MDSSPQGVQEIQGNLTRVTSGIPCGNTVCKGTNNVNEFQTRSLFN